MHVLSQPLFAPRLVAGATVSQLTVASLSAVAAGIHAWVVPEHYEEYALFGLFFAALGFAQAGWAAAVLRRPTRRVAFGGVALSAGLLVLWALSRTAGLPIGPEAWEAEPAGLLDVVGGRRRARHHRGGDHIAEPAAGVGATPRRATRSLWRGNVARAGQGRAGGDGVADDGDGRRVSSSGAVILLR